MRKARTSRALVRAEGRLAKIKQIESAFDFGGGLNAGAFTAHIKAAHDALDAYNAHLAKSDELKNVVKSFEIKLEDFYARALEGVAAKYGKDSSQYDVAGGTMKSARKKRHPKANGNGSVTSPTTQPNP